VLSSDVSEAHHRLYRTNPGKWLAGVCVFQSMPPEKGNRVLDKNMRENK
jgi:hypothetical protein